MLAIETYEQDPKEFYPFSSKFDEVQRKKATFTPAEQRGEKLFFAQDKGNCGRCHASHNQLSLFTDFGYIALGVPRAQNAVGQDLGLCGPLRTDLADRNDLCGMFRTPTLRNVARKHRYFHNGSMSNLTDVVRFYATRDSNPAKWVPDLPAQYRGNLDRELPFGSKTAVLTEPEIADIVAFLKTLDDQPI